jgi:hypothetical protein
MIYSPMATTKIKSKGSALEPNTLLNLIKKYSKLNKHRGTVISPNLRATIAFLN